MHTTWPNLKTPAAFHAAYMPQSEFNSQLEIQNQNFPEGFWGFFGFFRK